MLQFLFIAHLLWAQAPRSLENVLRSPIYDFHRSHGLFVLSNNGIFLSDNGQIWHPLPQFETNNYPVKIVSSRVIIVGDQISFDRGLHFEPYLRWDKVLDEIPHRKVDEINRVRLVKIKEYFPATHTLRLLLSYDLHKTHEIEINYPLPVRVAQK